MTSVTLSLVCCSAAAASQTKHKGSYSGLLVWTVCVAWRVCAILFLVCKQVGWQVAH